MIKGKCKILIASGQLRLSFCVPAPPAPALHLHPTFCFATAPHFFANMPHPLRTRPIWLLFALVRDFPCVLTADTFGTLPHLQSLIFASYVFLCIFGVTLLNIDRCIPIIKTTKQMTHASERSGIWILTRSSKRWHSTRG